MASKGKIEGNKNKIVLISKYQEKRRELKTQIYDKTLHPEERLAFQIALDALPRNSSAIRKRNRCELTGRPRGYYRKFRLSRICLREMVSFGLLPGVRKASW